MILRTPRLLLREFRSGDLPAIEAINSVPEFHTYENDHPWTVDEMRQRLERMIADASESDRRRYALVVTIPPDDTPAGWLKLTRTSLDCREWEIGWAIHRPFWGRGYASEAASAVMQFAAEKLNAHRIVAFCHADNTASRRVMEKIGLEYEGKTRATRRLHDQWWDELIYAAILQD